MKNLLDLFNNLDIVSYLFLLVSSGILLLITSHKVQIVQYIAVIVIPILFIHKNFDFNFIGNSPVIKPIEFFNIFPIEFRYTKISSIFLIMVGVLWLINNLYSIGYLRIKKIDFTHFVSLIFASVLCVVLIACSWNLFTLFVFYELLTFITYFLVSFDDSMEAKATGIKYFSVLFVSSTCFFLIAIAILYGFSGNLGNLNLNFAESGGILSFQFTKFWYISAIALVLFLYGCSKAATAPLHFWLPEAMVAHTPVSALLHAVAVVKSGIIALLYIIVYVFGLEFLEGLQSSHSIAFSIPKYIAGLSALYASTVALKKLELKKVLAYSTIGQLGYMVMIVFSFHDQMPQVLMLHLIAHGVAKINMFFIAGFLYLKYKIQKIDEICGIWRFEKIICICFAISVLSIIGIPPTVGMMSKFNILIYGIRNEEWFMIGVILLGTILNCYYFLPILMDMFFGRDKEKEEVEIENGMNRYFNLLYVPIIVIAVLVIVLFFIPYRGLI